MEIKTFEDLIIWQRSFRLAVDVYKEFISCKSFSVRDQLIKSALSVPSNISEGFERESNKEYIRFLDIAKGSLGELRTQLLFAQEVEIIKSENCQPMIQEAKEVSKMIGGLIKSRKSIQKKKS